MAVNRAIGFGHFDSVADWGAKGHNASGSNVSFSNTGGRGNRGYVSVGLNSDVHVVMTSAQAETYHHVAFNTDARAHTQFYEFRSATNTHMIIEGFEDGSIGVYTTGLPFSGGAFLTTGGTLVAVSDPGVWRASTWHHLQMGFVCSNTSGSLTIKIDGIQILSYTGNTYAGSGNMNVVSGGLGTNFGIGFVNYSDWVIVDTDTVDDLGQTTSNVSYVGDAAVYESVDPTDGFYLEWVRSTGSGTWSSHVNQNPKDDDTTYLRSPTDGDRNSFTFPDVTSIVGSGTIIAFGVIVAHRKEDASFGAIKLLARDSAGGVHTSAAHACVQTYIFDEMFIEKDPKDASSLTIAKVNATQLGIYNNSGT